MKGLLVLTNSENNVCAVINPKSKDVSALAMQAIGEELCGDCTELNMFDLSMVEYQPQEIDAVVDMRDGGEDEQPEHHTFTLTYAAYYK